MWDGGFVRGGRGRVRGRARVGNGHTAAGVSRANTPAICFIDGDWRAVGGGG